MAGHKKLSAEAQRVVAAGLKLSKEERDLIGRALQAFAAEPELYPLLKSSFNANHLYLAEFTKLSKDSQVAVMSVCNQLSEFLGHMKKVEQYAIAAIAVRQAIKYCQEKGAPQTTPSILSVLRTSNIKRLLSKAFPGYSMDILATTLCKRSTTSPSSTSTGLTIVPEERTSPPATSTSNAPGAARRIRLIT